MNSVHAQFYINDIVKNKCPPYNIGRVLQSQFQKDDCPDNETCDEINSRKSGLIKIDWNSHFSDSQLKSPKWVSPHHLELVDRTFEIGSYVGNQNDSTCGIGIVSDISSIVTIKNVLTGREIEGVTNQELTFYSPFDQDSPLAVIYQDWLGWVTNVEYRYIIKFEGVSDDDAILSVDHPQFLNKLKLKKPSFTYPISNRSSSNSIEVGRRLKGSAYAFMRLTNTRNSYLIKEQGNKVVARTISRSVRSIDVDWVTKSPNKLYSSITPPNRLEGAQLQQVHLFSKFIHSRFEVGDHVRLQVKNCADDIFELDDDMAAMSFLYTSKVHNEYQYPWVITNRQATAHVIWQNGIHNHHISDLFPRRLISDHEVWPGQVITQKDDGSLGQVISVNPEARTCNINCIGSHDPTNIKFQNNIEEDGISIYQIFPLSEFNYFPGDLVMLHSEALKSTYFDSQSCSWIGEITGRVIQGKSEVFWINGSSSFISPRKLWLLDSVDSISCNAIDNFELLNDELESLCDSDFLDETESDYCMEKENTRRIGQHEVQYSSSMAEDPFDIESLKTNNLDEGVASSFHSFSSTQESASKFSEFIFDTKIEYGPGFDIEDCPPEDHKFINYVQNSRSSPSFLKRIAREHKILRSHLPPTIWVRGFSSRLDLLRVIIMGPGGTPFAGGLYQFDLYLDPEKFPNEPPQCHYWARVGLQAGSGDSRPLNPNLYPTGRVCLSLLGTWEGQNPQEQWVSHHSSILQLVVSLQSLVLVQEPFFNEAGYDKMVGTPEGQQLSKAYNEHAFLLSLQTIPQAMKHTPTPFESIIKEFYMNSLPNIILKCKLLLEENWTNIQCIEHDGTISDSDLALRYFAIHSLSKGVKGLLKEQVKKLEAIYIDLTSQSN